MTKLAVERFDIEGTDAFFQSCEGFEHLRSRKRGPVLTVVSGPADDPIQHVRLRRVTKQWWEVEAPTSSGRWQRTGLRGLRIDLLDTLVTDFEWLIAPRE